MAVTFDSLLADVAVLRRNGPLNPTISTLTYDSRRVTDGSLFVAIRGQHSDGHRYLAAAAAAGAAALVVDQAYDGPLPEQVAVAVVANSRVALAPIAAAFYGRPGSRLLTIGITGTKGKSTTSDLTAQLLQAAGRRCGLITTVDFMIGPRRWANATRQSTPEAPEVQALLHEMVADGCSCAVLEATSHALSADWDRLAGSHFQIAAFLNLGHEHLDYHGSFEQYRAAKARLFAMLPADGSGWAVVNADDPSHEAMIAAAPPGTRILRYGFAEACDVRAAQLELTPGGSRCQLATPWGAAELDLPLPGRFNLLNALCALSVALCAGITPQAAAAALRTVQAPRGRMVPIRAGQPFDVIVDYAHNPDSFEQLFSTVRPLTAGRMIAVFGSAGERDIAKRAIQGRQAAEQCELLVLTDEDPRGEDRMAILQAIAAGAEQAGKQLGSGYLLIPDRSAAVRAAVGAARPGDLVLLLGKGHEGSIIYADRAQPWDEAAEAYRALAELGYRTECAANHADD
jgi:UDP-N-acetylmuramoyl-L-alanyl-D-glutamate--2,6-diaminopimelate ligase